MIEHGSVHIKKKILIRDFFKVLENIAIGMGDEYKIAYGSIDTDGYFIGPRKLKAEDTEVVVGLNKLSSLRIHFGTRVGIIICRNMDRKITLLVIRKDERIPAEDMNKIMECLLEFTGGKFVASV